MPFSRSISRTASTISCVISPALPFVDQVPAHDRVVRDLDCLVPGAQLEDALACGDELAAEAGPAVERLAESERDLAADCAPEVLRLADGALDPGRRDLDRVAVEVAAQHVRDALAERVVDALRVVDVHGHALRTAHLERQHLDSGHAGLDRLADL